MRRRLRRSMLPAFGTPCRSFGFATIASLSLLTTLLTVTLHLRSPFSLARLWQVVFDPYLLEFCFVDFYHILNSLLRVWIYSNCCFELLSCFIVYAAWMSSWISWLQISALACFSAEKFGRKTKKGDMFYAAFPLLGLEWTEVSLSRF